MNPADSAALRLFEKHAGSLQAARSACLERGWFSLFQETPDRHPGGEAAREAAAAAFRTQLGRPFGLDQPGAVDRVGDEVSPYTCEPLGIDYPLADVDTLFAAARRAMSGWAAAAPDARLGVCMEIVERLYGDVFLCSQAVLHTVATFRQARDPRYR